MVPQAHTQRFLCPNGVNPFKKQELYCVVITEFMCLNVIIFKEEIQFDLLLYKQQQKIKSQDSIDNLHTEKTNFQSRELFWILL